jgi:nitrogen regulatory protein PII
MRLYNIKLLTIICEIMAQNLVKDILKKHKISGYTSYEVGGMGDSGLRGQGLPEEKNVKIEAVMTEESAEKVVEEISRTMFSDYAIIFYLGDVQVARMEKFGQ